MSKPKFFRTAKQFRDWLAKNHRDKTELWVGFYKKGTGLPSITWPESVDQALCFGWIDGLRRSIDGESYMIRFTPRKPESHWSAVNIKRIGELREMRLLEPAGEAAFARRKESRSGQASYEQRTVALAPEFEKQLKNNKQAWAYFQSLAPSKRKTSIHWVMSAKQEKTRLKRLEILIECSARGEVIPPLRWGK